MIGIWLYKPIIIALIIIKTTMLVAKRYKLKLSDLI